MISTATQAMALKPISTIEKHGITLHHRKKASHLLKNNLANYKIILPKIAQLPNLKRHH